MAEIMEMAKSLGNALARTDQYQELRRVMAAADDDRELVEVKNALEKLEDGIESTLRAGQQPDQETADEYEALVGRLQANSTYQRLVSAQTNFDKVLRRVNDTIAKGMEEGATSRIILST